MRKQELCYKCGGPHFQSICTNLKESAAVINSKTEQPYSKITKETTTHSNCVTIRITAIHTQQENYLSRHPNRLGQVMICQ